MRGFISSFAKHIPVFNKGRMTRNAIGSLGIKITNALLSVMVSVILGNWLGVKGYGDYAYSLSWVALLSMVAVLGLDQLAVREIPKAIAKNDVATLKGYSKFSSLSVLIVGCILGVVMMGISRLSLFTMSPTMVKTLSIAGIALPLTALLRLQLGIFRGLKNVLLGQIPVMVLVPFLSLVSIASLHAVDLLTSVSAVGMYIFSLGLALLGSSYALVRKKIFQGQQRTYRVRSWLRASMLFLVNSFVFVFMNQISVLALGTIRGSESAGIFDIVYKLSMLISFGLMSINMVIEPIIAENYAKGDFSEIQRIAQKAALFSLIIATCIVFPLLFLSPLILEYIGEGFSKGTTALVILLVGQLVNISAGSVGLILNMTEHEQDVTKVIFFAAIINAILCFLLIPKWGLEGAAIASVFGMAIWNILLLAKVWKRLGINPTRFSLDIIKIKKYDGKA